MERNLGAHINLEILWSERRLVQVHLDEIEKAFLRIVQEEVPLVKQPWDMLAMKLGITYEDLMERIQRLHDEGVIRRFSPVLETDKVGLSARTLVLMKVPPERIDEVANIVNSFEVVTHNYEREHEYNLWFTIITSSQERLESSLKKIIEATRIPYKEILDLPVTKKHKIKVNFEIR